MILFERKILLFLKTKMEKKHQIKLGYWAIRGRAQISRLLLAYTGAEW